MYSQWGLAVYVLDYVKRISIRYQSWLVV